MPISTFRGTPPGSDGRGPTVAQQQAAGLTTLPATTNQFQGFIDFGALAMPAISRRGTLNTNLSYTNINNVENLDLPRGKINNQIVVIMPTARIGSPYIARRVSFLFGAIIPVPDADEFGVLLTTVNTNINPNRPIQRPEDYWLAEPYSTAGHTNSGYYWSKHAQAVFAVNPGPLRIPWRRAASSTNASPPPGVGTVTLLGIPYVVSTNQYFVSGSAVKTPRTMFWTEKSFMDTGKTIEVPSARVGGVKIVFNNNVPERVASEVVIPDYTPPVTTNAYTETRTLWFDEPSGLSGGRIRAYNLEGRVFLELLGDPRPNETRQHLGFEIVDIVREPNPNNVTIELGEILTAYPNGSPEDSDLFPEPVLQAAAPGPHSTRRARPSTPTRSRSIGPKKALKASVGPSASCATGSSGRMTSGNTVITFVPRRPPTLRPKLPPSLCRRRTRPSSITRIPWMNRVGSLRKHSPTTVSLQQTTPPIARCFVLVPQGTSASSASSRGWT
jgi:hypothetical protein